jgi:transcriptional regulator with XRE-family HTH domain
MVAAMAKVADPGDEIVRKNLEAFRKNAALSQAEAADLSGVPLDNLRRYENGTVANVPGSVLRALALSYGHSMDDFYLEDPPAAKLTEAPVFFLKTRPGAEIDTEIYAEVRAAIETANKKIRGKKSKR